jgi:drug/metabolite transporter (DMT)-like permease
MRWIDSGCGKRSIGVLLVLISAAAFAIGPTAAKLAFDNGSNVLTVAALRGLIGAVLLGVLIAILGQSIRIGRAALRWCLLGSAFTGLMVYGFIGSVSYIPVGVAVLIFFTHPILIAAFVHRRGSDRLAPAQFLFAFGALVGLALALAPTFDTIDPIGVALAALAAVTVCGAILCGARAQQVATSTQVNFYVTAITGAAFAILTFALADWSLPINAVGWLGVVGAGFGIAVGLLTFFVAFRYLSPVRATMLSNVEPLLSILFAATVLGERLQPLQWTGAAIMIGSIVLFEAAERAVRPSAAESDPG